MVHEVVYYHTYGTCEGFGKIKASVAERIQEAKVGVIVYHRTEED
jgi:hypothetical protein